ncbi:Uncharacterised protein [Chlamydia trachomatis]|nr:Uncharacterised protein [Chlamydia trachomatis]
MKEQEFIVFFILFFHLLIVSLVDVFDSLKNLVEWFCVLYTTHSTNETYFEVTASNYYYIH